MRSDNKWYWNASLKEKVRALLYTIESWNCRGFKGQMKKLNIVRRNRRVRAPGGLSRWSMWLWISGELKPRVGHGAYFKKRRRRNLRVCVVLGQGEWKGLLSLTSYSESVSLTYLTTFRCSTASWKDVSLPDAVLPTLGFKEGPQSSL